jgi:hypothetical protein
MKVTPLGDGKFHVLDSIYIPGKPNKNIDRLVGKGTRWQTYGGKVKRPIRTEEHARSLGQQWRDEVLSGSWEERSLTFGRDCDTYLVDNDLQPCIRNIVTYLKKECGAFPLSDFQKLFRVWIKLEAKRDVRRWKKVDGFLSLEDTGKRLSPTTIQAYRRYTKLILTHSGHSDSYPADKDLKVGKAEKRRRPITPDEMLKLEETIGNKYPWFFKAFDAARKSPVRPEDQFAFLYSRHFIKVEIPKLSIKIRYENQKTGTWAQPIIWPEQVDSLLNPEIESDFIYPWKDGTSCFPGCDLEDEYSTNRRYNRLFRSVCRLQGIRDLRFYDLRHNAVAYCRSKGVEDWRIIKAAGWTSGEMLEVYDPDNESLIDDYDTSIFRKPSTGESTGIGSVALQVGEK